MFEPLICGSEKIPQNSRQISLPKIRDGETTIKIKFAVLRGGHWGAERKIIQNAIFVENVTTIKVFESANFILADVSDIFFFFLLGGRGNGESGAPGGGRFDFSLKIPGGGSPGGRGAEGSGGCLRRIGDSWGGWAKYLFSGPKCPPSYCREILLSLRRLLPEQTKKSPTSFCRGAGR